MCTTLLRIADWGNGSQKNPLNEKLSGLSDIMAFDIESDSFQASPLAKTYEIVRNELEIRDGKRTGAHHRIALAVAWFAHDTAPTYDADTDLPNRTLREVAGLPKTKKEMAAVLGISTRSLRRYQDNYADLIETSRNDAVRGLLNRYRLTAVMALGQSASVPDPKHAADRRTLFTITGDLVKKTETELSTKDGQTPIAILNVDVEKLR